MKFKTFAIILALFGFSASLFAQPVSYSFSSFGGGLPSSAKKVSFSANADTVTSQRIIVSLKIMTNSLKVIKNLN